MGSRNGLRIAQETLHESEWKKCECPSHTACPAPWSITTLCCINRSTDKCKFLLQKMIYLKADKLLDLLNMCIIAEVFFLCVLSQNPIVHQGLCHCGSKSAFLLLSGKKKRNRVRRKGGSSPSRCFAIAQSK